MDILKLKLSDDNGIPTRALASMLGIDSDTVRDLEDRGFLSSETIGGKKFYPMVTSVREYCDYLRRQTKASICFEDDEARRAKAEADLKEAKAEIEKLKLAEFQGIMHRSEDVEALVTDLAITTRAELLALPGMLAIDLANATTPAEAAGILKRALYDVLNTLAEHEYNPEVFKERVKEREKWIISGKSIEQAENDDD